MIDTEKYTLTYFRKSDEKAVKAFIPEHGKIHILEDNVIHKLTRRQALELYRPCRDNNRSRNKPKYMRPKLARKEGGYEEYLNSGYDKLCTNF
jgi:hypothetical protein